MESNSPEHDEVTAYWNCHPARKQLLGVEKVAFGALLDDATEAIRKYRNPSGWYSGNSVLFDALVPPLTRYIAAVFDRRATIRLRDVTDENSRVVYDDQLQFECEGALKAVYGSGGIYQQTVRQETAELLPEATYTVRIEEAAFWTGHGKLSSLLANPSIRCKRHKAIILKIPLLTVVRQDRSTSRISPCV